MKANPAAPVQRTGAIATRNRGAARRQVLPRRPRRASAGRRVRSPRAGGHAPPRCVRERQTTARVAPLARKVVRDAVSARRNHARSSGSMSTAPARSQQLVIQAPVRKDEQHKDDGDPETVMHEMSDRPENLLARARGLGCQPQQTGENHHPADRALRPGAPATRPAATNDQPIPTPRTASRTFSLPPCATTNTTAMPVASATSASAIRARFIDRPRSGTTRRGSLADRCAHIGGRADSFCAFHGSPAFARGRPVEGPGGPARRGPRQPSDTRGVGRRSARSSRSSKLPCRSRQRAR